MSEISLEGLDKGAVLAALYNASKPLGMGFLQYKQESMTAEEGNEFLKKNTYFDYLNGRVMKIDLSRQTLDPWGYDRDIGEGAAQRVIDALRTGDAKTIQSMHAEGKREAVDKTRKALSQETTFQNGIMRLGLADVADPLSKAIDRAED